jgi:hypothetical protein
MPIFMTINSQVPCPMVFALILMLHLGVNLWLTARERSSVPVVLIAIKNWKSMVIYKIHIYQYMIGIHSHISLFGHGLISVFLNVCKLLAGACMMTSHTGLAGTGCDDVIFCKVTADQPSNAHMQIHVKAHPTNDVITLNEQNEIRPNNCQHNRTRQSENE